MNVLNQVEIIAPTSSKMSQDPNESVAMECGRLIHAAVISKRFLSSLLADPIKSIEAGFCGETFAFTREEKQQIKRIHASSLADFSNQLILAVEHACCLSPATEMAYARLDTHKRHSA
jgi:hypothetical protein